MPPKVSPEFLTNAVVASNVVLSKTAGVGAVGEPVSAGLIDSTLLPVPVDVVVPVPPFNTANVPVTPVDNGKLVALVSTPDDGVPNAGDTNVGVVIVGLVDNTSTPVPVAVVPPVPPFNTGNVPVTPVDNGKPVALVNTPDAGVPSNGAVKVGPVANTNWPVPVAVVVPEPPLAIGNTPFTPVVKGNPMALVSINADGVPSAGVTSVGLTLSTTLPLPVLLVTPVPPLATASSPLTVTTPDVDVDGVKPVVPNEIEATPVAAAKTVHPTDEYPSKAFASVEYRI